MTALLVFVVIMLFFVLYNSVKRTEKANQHYAIEKGSRAVEKEEWRRWINTLFDEYCQLAGLTMELSNFDIPWDKYEEVAWEFRLNNIFGNSHYAICAARKGGYSTFTDTAIIEELRIKHGFPSDAELIGTSYDRRYGKKSHYESLFNLMNACVNRAVVQRGYKMGGMDFDEMDSVYRKTNSIEKKYNWLENDPTNTKKK